MKKPKTIHFLLFWGILLFVSVNIHAQAIEKKPASMKTTQLIQKTDTLQQILIDKFIVPLQAIPEFRERMTKSRDFIKNLPGFIEDKVYEHTNEEGSLVCITMATWTNEDAIKKAKEVVQAEYKKEGFNLQEMLKKMNITIDRGIYTNAGN